MKRRIGRQKGRKSGRKRRKTQGADTAIGTNDSEERNELMEVININSETLTGTKKRPLGPRPGAMFSTREMLQSFQISNGLTSNNNIQGGLANAFGSFAFTLGDLPQAGSFTTLFDQYRLDEVEVWIKPRGNSIPGSSSGFTPTLFVVIDRDDSSSPTSIQYLQEYDNCVMLQVNEGLKMRFKPSVAPALYASGAFTGYAIEQDLWVDASNTAVPHYGVKWGLTGTAISSPGQYVWEVICYGFWSFKNAH